MSRVRLASIILLAGSAQAWACEAERRLLYDQPVEIEGTLRTGTGQHDAQGAFAYSYIALDQPVCVDASPGNDEFSQATERPIERIQLAGEEAGKDLPFGKHVAATGTLFGAHTMWHAEDVLMDVSELKQK